MTGAMELQPDDGPRLSLSIGPGSDDVVEPHRELARRFAERIGKLAGNTPGDHRKKTIGLTTRMLEVTRLGGIEPNQLIKELVNIRFKPKLEKWREPPFGRFRRVNH
ncbi:hypothetical protein BHM03_00029175 [Ensete ventricosum]|nr:hypothetical protein BHM03_00029175 [Ensete ventricosum]